MNLGSSQRADGVLYFFQKSRCISFTLDLIITRRCLVSFLCSSSASMTITSSSLVMNKTHDTSSLLFVVEKFWCVGDTLRSIIAVAKNGKNSFDITVIAIYLLAASLRQIQTDCQALVHRWNIGINSLKWSFVYSTFENWILLLKQPEV